MMNKYLLSKILFAIFSTTTLIIFIQLISGVFIDLVGSAEMAVIIFTLNSVLLITSIVWYVWQKSQKDASAHLDEEILQAYAMREEKHDSEPSGKLKND